MKYSLIFFSLFFCEFSLAVKTVQFDSIGFGKLLNMSAMIQLPQGQKLNHAAPSRIAVYEKDAGKWNLTEEVSLNAFFTLTEMIHFRRPVKLKSEKSEIKVEANLYHCPRVGRGICVIDDFEGLVQRSAKKASSEIKVSLLGSQPK